MSNSLLPQKELNKDFWPNGTEGKLNSQIRYQLLKVAKSFKDTWDLEEIGLKDVKITDIQFTGSLANYNWSDMSDVDCHIVVDYSRVSEDYRETVKAYLLALKNLFNTEHNVTIKGFEVEVYPEDKATPATSTGVYSLITDHWIVTPSYQEVTPDREYIKDKAKTIINIIDLILSGKYSAEQTATLIDHLLKKLKKMRQNGLSQKGEFAENNLVFKVLRRLGYIDKLRDLEVVFTDEDLSLFENK